MSNDIKDKIEKLLSMCTRVNDKDDTIMGIDPLSKEEHEAMQADAVAITNSLIELQRLAPLSTRLAELGRLLECQHKLVLETEEPYDEAALRYFSEHFGLDMSSDRVLH